MGKKTIFFDLDDTLYDRAVPYQEAFSTFFGGRYAEKAAQAFDTVIHRGYEVFAAAHTGQMTMDAMHIYRHQQGLRDVGIEITAAQALEFQALYAGRQRKISLTETMRRVLDVCSARFAAIGVLTNGGVQSQQDKLASLGMERWAKPELILISDALGVMKPGPEIFHLAERAAGCGPEVLVYVGDSLTQDVAGAGGCGWETVWLNRRGERTDGIRPDWTVDSEAALLAWAEGQGA